jgi:hypothetical protein
MPTTTTRRKGPNLFRMFLIALVGAILISGGLGYLIGSSSAEYTFTPQQTQFVDGIVAGTQYKSDYDDWKKVEPRNGLDPRSEPETRCASKFYPDKPLGMEGCLMALQGRPPAGYKMPVGK